MTWLQPARARALLIAMVTAAIALSGILVVLLLARFVPVDVLKDWSIALEDKDYESGSIITFTSKATKVREAEGVATRYLKCAASQNDDDHEYELDAKTVNRPTGERPPSGNDIRLPVVEDPPRRCKLYIAIKYDLYPYLREPFYEYAETEYFTVTEKKEPAVKPSQSQPVRTQNAPVFASPEPPTPLAQQPAQMNQVPAMDIDTGPSTTPPAPGLVERVLTPVSDLLEFLL